MPSHQPEHTELADGHSQEDLAMEIYARLAVGYIAGIPERSIRTPAQSEMLSVSLADFAKDARTAAKAYFDSKESEPNA